MYGAGKSIEGRSIMAVKLTGQGFSHGMPRMVITCALHAREWITAMTCTYAIQEFIKKAKADSTWLANTEVVIMPVVNPDGLIYSQTTSRMWRKNRRVNASWGNCQGVDLNRNFNPAWGGPYASSNPCSDGFYGSAAFSEPETVAVTKVIDEAPISLHLDIHSFGEMILLPWSHTWTPHPRKAEIDAVGQGMGAAIAAVNGRVYKVGGNELLGPASGACQDYSIPGGGLGFTYEVRPGLRAWNGFAPPASDILRCATENLAGFIAGVTWMQGGELPTKAPTPPPPACRRRWNCLR